MSITKEDVQEIFKAKLSVLTPKYSMRAYHNMEACKLEELSLPEIYDCIQCYKYMLTARPNNTCIEKLKQYYDL